MTNGVAAINQHVKTAKHKSKLGKGTQAGMESFFVKKEAKSEDVWSVKDLSVKAGIVAEKEEKSLKEKQAAAKEEKKAKKRQAEERYNDVMKELAGLNEEADKLQEHLDRTMQSIWEETAKITGAKGDAIQIAAAVHQLEFWKKQQTELSTKIAEIGQKRKQKDEEKDALAKKSKL